MQVMVLSQDRDKGRVALSTRKLERTKGDMLRDPQKARPCRRPQLSHTVLQSATGQRVLYESCAGQHLNQAAVVTGAVVGAERPQPHVNAGV